jgi:sigma-B regulation protein RsbQ
MSTLMFLILAAALPAGEKTLRLSDGVEMAYVDRGKGDPALVFVHCGNCRKEIWRETLDAFAGDHRVVAMDMPGYGHSSATSREKSSLEGLGADVAALVDELKLQKVVLVGNSLGGPVALEAAHRLGPKRVLGVVAVDTLQNVELEFPEEIWRRILDGHQQDFVKTCDRMMLSLLPDGAPESTRQRIDEETCANEPKVAIAIHESFRTYDQTKALRDAGVPVVAINATRVPTAVDVNRKYARSFDVILMEGVGHYPQVERPAEFQANLRRALAALEKAGR